jgi:hypothetical protein
VKRIVLGTFSCLVIVISLLALASRWPALFWVVVLSLSLYLLFGRNVEVELRFGVGGGEERRVYVALVWKRRAGAVESAGAQELARLQVGPGGRDR